MPRWLRRILSQIRDCAAQRRVRFTYKALREIAELGLGLDEMDAIDVLAGLTERDFAARVRSELTGEWLHVFKPEVGGTVIYVKVVLRASCVVVSFHGEVHEDEGENGSQEE